MKFKITGLDLEKLSGLELGTPLQVGDLEILVNLKDTATIDDSIARNTIQRLFAVNLEVQKFNYKMVEVMADFTEETGKKQIPEFYAWLYRNITAEINLCCESCQEKGARFPLNFRRELQQKVRAEETYFIPVSCVGCGHDSSVECYCNGCSIKRRNRIENSIAQVIDSYKSWIATFPEQDSETFSTKSPLKCSADYRDYINEIRLVSNESRHEFAPIHSRIHEEISLGLITFLNSSEEKVKNWIESQQLTSYEANEISFMSQRLDRRYSPRLFLSGLKLNRHFISDYYNQIVKEQSNGGLFCREEQLIDFVIRYSKKTLGLDLTDISDETKLNIISIFGIMDGHKALTVAKNTINYADRHNRERLSHPTPDSLKNRVILYLNRMYQNYSDLGWQIPQYSIPLWELIDLYGVNPLIENIKFNEFLLTEFDSEESFCNYFNDSASISEGLRDLERLMRNSKGAFARIKENFIDKEIDI